MNKVHFKQTNKQQRKKTRQSSAKQEKNSHDARNK